MKLRKLVEAEFILETTNSLQKKQEKYLQKWKVYMFADWTNYYCMVMNSLKIPYRFSEFNKNIYLI